MMHVMSVMPVEKQNVPGFLQTIGEVNISRKHTYYIKHLGTQPLSMVENSSHTFAICSSLFVCQYLLDGSICS